MRRTLDLGVNLDMSLGVNPGANRDAKLDVVQRPKASGEGSAERFQADGRAPWLSFVAPTLVTDTRTGRVLRMPAGEIDEYWCFVRTSTPFLQGTRIDLQIARAGELFAALGRVTYVANGGMGIVFTTVEADSREILKKWLGIGAGQAPAPGVKLAS